MKSFSLAILILQISYNTIFSQEIMGKVLRKVDSKPVEYVNIGVINRNTGTVSDINGHYSLEIPNEFNDDTLIFSCIGYHTVRFRVEDFKKAQNHDIFLQERVFALKEVTIRPRKYINKRLGVSTSSAAMQAGFQDNKLGYECGVVMKIKKSAILETLNINIARCGYDSVFYRVNFYNVSGKKSFKNLLTSPIYLSRSKSQIQGNTLSLDLRQYNLEVYGDVLVTLEHVKDLGQGNLYFCTRLKGKTYFRKTSHGNWESVPIGISISVDARVEK